MRNNVPGADNYILQESITAYADEAYTNARKLNSTGIIASGDPKINKDTETFIGQMRWFKPLNAKVNVASLTDATDGQKTTYASEFAKYVKTVRTHGAEKVNMQEIVTKDDGLAKVGRDFAETRSQDEHNAILSILKGVAISEVLNGAGVGTGQAGLGGQTFDNDPTNSRYGFYVDLGSAKPVVAASAAQQGASRAEGLLQALGMAWKDYEPEYVYVITSPEVMASFRSANLVDSDKVSDGNINFETLFGGKFRLIQTRATQSLSSAQFTKVNTGSGIDIVGAKTTFMALPGSIAMEGLSIPVPTEITRKGDSYNGGGSTSIWYRWGYIGHPAGYNWSGSEDKFAADADYMKALVNGTPTDLTNVVDGLANTTGTWIRKASSALSLGILPVFHS